jgi:hypothetical protein
MNEWYKSIREEEEAKTKSLREEPKREHGLVVGL